MRQALIALAAAGALAVIAPAAAVASGSHRCGIGGGEYVAASNDTSCPFAYNIAHAWLKGRCWRFAHCHGSTFSPVTDRTYSVSCTETGHHPERVFCRSNGNNSWIRFSYASA